MNSLVPPMKQMIVQKRHTFAAGLKQMKPTYYFYDKEYDNKKEYDETDDDRHL